MNWTVAAAALTGGFAGAAGRDAIRAVRDWRRNRQFGARLAAALASPERWQTTVLPPAQHWTSNEQEPPQ